MKKYQLFFSWRLCLVLLMVQVAFTELEAQVATNVKVIPVDSGWAANSVNAVVFRKNSLVSNTKFQYIAYYDPAGYVVLGKRKIRSSQWQLRKTSFRGNVADAHNMISIMVDGDDYLHLSWDHHNNQLNYSRSLTPGSLEMTGRLSMTGSLEEKVTYPEFHKLPSGDLVFFYRDGGSGNGNLVINRYNTTTRSWKQVHQNLVDGEGKRNAYWQACVDAKGSIHISWVWRESPDVASNHDMCYARSDDGGVTWKKSTGENYRLPITASNAEYACRIPAGSELINQTSMYADENGTPWIATYWRKANDSIPQYKVIFKQNNAWTFSDPGFRKTPFSLSGAGTKAIPISRPQIVVGRGKSGQNIALIFRDIERGNKVSVATTNDPSSGTWTINDLVMDDVGSWEPSYDTELWKRKNRLSIFVQKVKQVDGEGRASLPPQMITVLDWTPSF
ncbi:MAG: BNR repeat-containing protein [Bacteroidota bacterium]